MEYDEGDETKSLALYRLNSDGGSSANGISILPVGSDVELYCSLHVLERLEMLVVVIPIYCDGFKRGSGIM